MKRLFILIMSVLLLVSFAVSAESVGMPNPVVSVRDDDAFEDILRIDVDADDLPARKIDMSIIDNKIGQISFELENVNGEMVPWTIRFTRDASLDRDAEAFAGIYDANMSAIEERVVDFQDDYDDPVIPITLAFQSAQTEGVDLYFWNYRGVHFSLIIEGDYSQMQFAEAMDAIFEACIDD